MEHHDEPSACSCRLPPGRWGQGGWHWGRATFNGLVRKFSGDDPELYRLTEKARGASADEREGIEERQRIIIRGIESVAEKQVGLPWAYERCPAYQAKVESEIRARKARSRSGDEDDQRVF